MFQSPKDRKVHVAKSLNSVERVQESVKLAELRATRARTHLEREAAEANAIAMHSIAIVAVMHLSSREVGREAFAVLKPYRNGLSVNNNHVHNVRAFRAFVDAYRRYVSAGRAPSSSSGGCKACAAHVAHDECDDKERRAEGRIA